MPHNLYDLAAYQRAQDIISAVHKLTRTFPKEELFGLVSQMRRASYSISNNIAEGLGRLTFGEKRQFLSQARGSLYEVESQLMIALQLHYADEDECADLRVHIRKCAAALGGYIRWVQNQERLRKK